MKLSALGVLMGVLVLTQPALAADDDLLGTWKVIAADVIRPDGTRVEDYGKAPLGIAIFTASGHYAVEIYKSERIKFATNDKFRGTPEEYKDASLSSSCHFGTYQLDKEKGTVTLKIESASFPNSAGTTRVSAIELKGDELTWRVPPRPDGSIPITTFRRVK